MDQHRSDSRSIAGERRVTATCGKHDSTKNRLAWRMVCSLQLYTRHVQSGDNSRWKMTVLEQFSLTILVPGSCLTCGVEIDIITIRNIQSFKLSANPTILNRSIMSQWMYEMKFAIFKRPLPLRCYNEYCRDEFWPEM